MTGLSVTGCTVAFGGLKAINDLTLAIPGGTITALIGPNGSGKSTFCNMVSGQIPPVSGRVLLGDEPMNGRRTDQIVAAGLARTYQVPRVPKELTIGEVIGVPLRYARSSRDLPGGMTTAGEVAKFCGLVQPLTESPVMTLPPPPCSPTSGACGEAARARRPTPSATRR